MLPYKALTDFLFTQTETVYYAVRTKCLDKIRVNFLERIKPICLVYNVQRGLSFVLYSKPLTLQPWVPIPLRACICLYRFLTLYIVHKRLTTGWTIRDRIPMRARFSARPDRPCGPFSLLYNGYRVFRGGKVWPGRAADHSPPPSVAFMEE